jgi:hypothetical protein
MVLLENLAAVAAAGDVQAVGLDVLVLDFTGEPLVRATPAIVGRCCESTVHG